MNSEVREKVAEFCPDRPVFFEVPEYDEAIIGATTDGRVVYDLYQMAEVLAQRENITKAEAMAFIEFNTVPLCAMEDAPTIIYPIEKEKRTCGNCAKCSISYPSHVVTCDIDNHVIAKETEETCGKHVRVEV